MSTILTTRVDGRQRVVATRRSKRRLPLRVRLSRIPLWVCIGLLLVVELYPLLWLLLSSFKSSSQFTSQPFWSLPAGLDWQNYADAWSSGMSTYFVNSILAVFPSLALIIVLSAAGGFALEVMLWRGRNTILLIFLAGILVPAQMLLLPLFTIYFKLGLIDTRWSLIITYTAYGLPLSVFLMAGFFKAVPRSVIEAAVLDGANVFQIFYHVAVPMVANGIVTIALVQFFFLWNDLLFSLTFIVSDSNRTIQTGLLNFTGEFGQTAWGPTFAAISLAVFPTLLLYLVLNQQVIKGLTAGSVKG